MSVTEPVRQALLVQKGQLGFLMGLMQDDEQANWPILQQRLDFVNVSENYSSLFYEDAIKWSQMLTEYHPT